MSEDIFDDSSDTSTAPVTVQQFSTYRKPVAETGIAIGEGFAIFSPAQNKWHTYVCKYYNAEKQQVSDGTNMFDAGYCHKLINAAAPEPVTPVAESKVSEFSNPVNETVQEAVQPVVPQGEVQMIEENIPADEEMLEDETEDEVEEVDLLEENSVSTVDFELHIVIDMSPGLSFEDPNEREALKAVNVVSGETITPMDFYNPFVGKKAEKNGGFMRAVLAQLVNVLASTKQREVMFVGENVDIEKSVEIIAQTKTFAMTNIFNRAGLGEELEVIDIEVNPEESEDGEPIQSLTFSNFCEFDAWVQTVPHDDDTGEAQYIVHHVIRVPVYAMLHSKLPGKMFRQIRTNLANWLKVLRDKHNLRIDVPISLAMSFNSEELLENPRLLEAYQMLRSEDEEIGIDGIHHMSLGLANQGMYDDDFGEGVEALFPENSDLLLQVNLIEEDEEPESEE